MWCQKLCAIVSQACAALDTQRDGCKESTLDKSERDIVYSLPFLSFMCSNAHVYSFHFVISLFAVECKKKDKSIKKASQL